jgi:hypothetical protein
MNRTAIIADAPDAHKLWDRVRKTDGCWEWTGPRQYRPNNSTRYGKLYFRRRTTNAHRVAYELTYGPVPPGMVVRHRCHNPICCRPDHLQVGTQLENIQDRDALGHNATRKLTPAKVQEIRRRYRAGDRAFKVLAIEYGVKPGAIEDIFTGRTWYNLPCEVAA